jgi:hypothetical protein
MPARRRGDGVVAVRRGPDGDVSPTRKIGAQVSTMVGVVAYNFVFRGSMCVSWHILIQMQRSGIEGMYMSGENGEGEPSVADRKFVT